MLIVQIDGHTTHIDIDGSETIEQANAKFMAAGVSSVVRAIDATEAEKLNSQYEAQRRASLLESLSVEEPIDILGACQMLGIPTMKLDALSTKDLESIRSMLEPDSY